MPGCAGCAWVGGSGRPWFLGRGVGGERIDECRHAGIKRAAPARERFVGLEHDRKFHNIEPDDPDQGTGTVLRRDALRMREGVADLPETHQLKAGGRSRSGVNGARMRTSSDIDTLYF